MPAESPETRLALIEDRQDRHEKTLESVAESLNRLVRIELQNNSIAATLADVQARVTAMEKDWPVVRQIKLGVEWAAKFILCGVFIAVLAAAGFKFSH